MAKSVDYYKLLGVSIFASEGEIRNAYLAKIKMYHPDKYKGSKKEAENITAELNIAYNTLKDKDKKYRYDKTYGFDIKRENYLRQKQREQKKLHAKKNKEAKRNKKQKNINDPIYATELKNKQKVEEESEANDELRPKDEKIKTNIFTKEPKKDVKRVKRHVKTPEERNAKVERLILDALIVGVLAIVIILLTVYLK